jgi:hypothetical protein
MICVSILQADIIHVPADQPTIQAGVDAAVDGDTVMVANGIYTGTENSGIWFSSMAIVVMSENGPDDCIIDCEETGSSGFIFNYSGNDSTSIVQGFTIRNGARGIELFESSPIIVGNIIKGHDNTYDPGGGGIYCYNSSPIIRGNVITENGAIDGGGIYCSVSSPIITGNEITKNTAYGGGWGSASGGGIFCGGTAVISHNTIVNNEAIGYGGGVYCNSNASPTLISNTILENTAEFGGGFCCDNTSPTITNTILWNNSVDEIYGEPVVTYSDVQGGWEGEGNIDEDPMFVLPEKLDYRLLWGSPCIDSGHPDMLDPDGTRSDMGVIHFNQDDYITLYLNSYTTRVWRGEQFEVTYTVINRWERPENFWVLTQAFFPGSDTLNVLGPVEYTMPADTTLQVQMSHDIIYQAPLKSYTYLSRIGLPPSTLYDEDSFTIEVAGTINIPEDYPTIQEGIDAAYSGGKVMVADGIYTGVGNRDLDFHGKAITLQSENGPENCIVDCEFEGRGFYFHSGEDSASVVQGFTIRNGNADKGGGIYCEWSSPTIKGNIITENTASSDGGGIYCIDGLLFTHDNTISETPVAMGRLQ